MRTVHRPLQVAVAVVAFAGSAFVAVPRASASAKHIVHGAGCLWFNDGSDIPPPFGGRHHGLGLHHQEQGAVVTAICAPERSNTSNTNGLLDLEIRILSLDGTNKSVNCYASSQRTDGSSVLDVSKSGFGTNFKIDFGATLNKSVSGGSYIIACDLPAFAALVSMYSSEP
jgi:hypothetical protein